MPSPSKIFARAAALLFGWSVRAHLILVLLAVAVPLTSLLAIHAVQGLADHRARADAHLTTAAQLVAARIDDDINSLNALLTGLGEALAQKYHKQAGVDVLLREVLDELPIHAHNLSFWSPRGTLVASALPAGALDVNGSAPPCVLQAIGARGLIIGEPFQVADAWKYCVARQVIGTDGEPLGVIRASVNFERFERSLWVRQQLSQNMLALVITEYGNIVASTAIGAWHLPSGVRSIAGGTGAGPAFDVKGIPYLSAQAPLQRASWQVLAAAPEAALLSGARRFLHYNILAASLIIALAFALAWALARRISTGLESVAADAVRWTGGEFTHRSRVTPGRGELGTLARTFNDMAATLEQTIGLLRERETRHRTVLDNLTEGVLLRDAHGVIVANNPSAERILGVPAGSLIGRQHMFGPEWEPLYEDGRSSDPAARPMLQALSNGKESTDVIVRVRSPDGRTMWLSCNVRPLLGPGDMASHGVVTSFTDITVNKLAETERAESEARFRELAENIDQVFWLCNRDATDIVYVSPAYARIWGLATDELYGDPNSWLKVVHADDRERVENAIRDDLPEGTYDAEYRIVRPDGALRWIHDRAFPVRDAAGSIYRIAGIAEDVTERKQNVERLAYLADYDVLTQLPNRTHLGQRTREVLARAGRRNGSVGLLFIDVDRFKNVNDTFGHAVGDELLKRVAERICENIRDGDIVARLGGDEFAVVLDDLAAVEDAAMVAQKLSDVLSQAYMLEGREVFATASMGISCYPADGDEFEELIKNADIAMYQAKAVGRNAYRFYSSEMNARAKDVLEITTGLRHALEQEQFVLHYQPRVNTKTGEVCGVEALIRWQHPERGLIPPGRFIPIAEETGLIEPIGWWALRAGCAQARAWLDAGLAFQCIAVNLSARQFADQTLATRIAALLDEMGLEPSVLELEITESMAMHDTAATERMLRELAALGIGVAIDDFGTGHSSLSYLKRFPVHCLKIDRSFVMGLPENAHDMAITKATIALAQALELDLVGEGVETEAQLAALVSMGCDVIQGYLMCKPLPAGECAGWLRGRSCADVLNGEATRIAADFLV